MINSRANTQRIIAKKETETIAQVFDQQYEALPDVDSRLGYLASLRNDINTPQNTEVLRDSIDIADADPALIRKAGQAMLWKHTHVVMADHNTPNDVMDELQKIEKVNPISSTEHLKDQFLASSHQANKLVGMLMLGDKEDSKVTENLLSGALYIGLSKQPLSDEKGVYEGQVKPKDFPGTAEEVTLAKARNVPEQEYNEYTQATFYGVSGYLKGSKVVSGSGDRLAAVLGAALMGDDKDVVGMQAVPSLKTMSTFSPLTGLRKRVDAQLEKKHDNAFTLAEASTLKLIAQELTGEISATAVDAFHTVFDKDRSPSTLKEHRQVLGKLIEELAIDTHFTDKTPENPRATLLVQNFHMKSNFADGKGGGYFSTVFGGGNDAKWGESFGAMTSYNYMDGSQASNVSDAYRKGVVTTDQAMVERWHDREAILAKEQGREATVLDGRDGKKATVVTIDDVEKLLSRSQNVGRAI